MRRPWFYIAAAILLIGGMTGAIAQEAPPGAAMDVDAIIRGLAPMNYLPEHGGKPRARARSIDLSVPFALNSATLTPAATRQLDRLAEALADRSLVQANFVIAGHTDASGPAAHNKALSERRAAAVRDYLVARGAIDTGRLRVEGWGEERLKDPIRAAAGINRRVEVTAIVVPAEGDGTAAKKPAEPMVIDGIKIN